MDSNPPRTTTPRDIARVLFRHWRRSFAVLCSMTALTLLAISLFPRSYESEAKLLIRVGRESVSLDPTATTGETITLQKSQLDEVISAQTLINSREVLQQVVDHIGAERILDVVPPPPSEQSKSDERTFGQAVSNARSWLVDTLMTLRLMDPVSIQEKALRRLEKGLKVTHPKDSMVLVVRYTASSPQLAQEVVAGISEAFLNEHLRLSLSEGSLEFFVSQTEKLHSELTSAQAELRDQMSEFQVTASGNRRSILEMSQEAMRQKLSELEIQENDLKTRYTAEYPVLREIRRQRADIESRLTELAKSQTTSDSGNMAMETAKVAPASTDLLSELKRVNQQEYKIAQLQREVDLLEGKYRAYKEKLEQARVNEEMGREQITNVKIAQAATLVERPVAPNKLLILAIGLLMGVFGAIGSSFLAESMDQTLRTTDQVEAELGLPVLLSLPNRATGETLVASVDRALSASTAVSNGSESDAVDQGTHYRSLVRALLANGNQHGGTSDRNSCAIGVVGCEPTVSRSRIAANLAIEAAKSINNPVLLIDADDRHRAVTDSFHINGSPGLREYLFESADPENCVHRQRVENLKVMSPGSPHNPPSQAIIDALDLKPRDQLNQIKSHYRMVVVDLPADREFDMPLPAASWIDETVLVVEAEQTRIQAALRAKTLLERSGTNVVGVVLANRRDHIPNWLYRRL